jgi:hypothetical protein
MVEVEGALRESLDIYKKNPVFILPHFVESILSLGVIISIVLTILLSIGVHVVDVALDDPEVLTSQIMDGGQGLIAIIILTLLFGALLIFIIKAAALAGVVQMANRGFKGEKVAFSDAVEGAKRYTLDLFLFWILLGFILAFLFVLAFIPAVILATLDISNILAIGAIILALLILIIGAMTLIVAVMFAPQYIVVEGSGVIGSIKKSFSFVGTNIAGVLIYIAVVMVFSFFLFGFFGIISLLPDLFYSRNQFIGASMEIFFFILRIGVGLIVAPYFEMVKTRMIIVSDSNDSDTS